MLNFQILQVYFPRSQQKVIALLSNLYWLYVTSYWSDLCYTSTHWSCFSTWIAIQCPSNILFKKGLLESSEVDISFADTESMVLEAAGSKKDRDGSSSEFKQLLH